MFDVMLLLHSWNRWFIVVAAVITIVAALQTRKDATKIKSVKKSSLIFSILVDVQFLIGLVLYFFLSPIVRAAMQSGAAMMKEPISRFWAVEHLLTMFLAVVLMHVGRVVAKKATNEHGFATRTLIFTGLFLILVLAAISWPQLVHGRPLFRF